MQFVRVDFWEVSPFSFTFWDLQRVRVDFWEVCAMRSLHFLGSETLSFHFLGSATVPRRFLGGLCNAFASTFGKRDLKSEMGARKVKCETRSRRLLGRFLTKIDANGPHFPISNLKRPNRLFRRFFLQCFRVDFWEKQGSFASTFGKKRPVCVDFWEVRRF